MVVWTDTDRAHGLACGEFDSRNNIEELVAVGYSQKTTMICYKESN